MIFPKLERGRQLSFRSSPSRTDKFTGLIGSEISRDTHKSIFSLTTATDHMQKRANSRRFSFMNKLTSIRAEGSISNFHTLNYFTTKKRASKWKISLNIQHQYHLVLVFKVMPTGVI